VNVHLLRVRGTLLASIGIDQEVEGVVDIVDE
jgi:hypothetical protein